MIRTNDGRPHVFDLFVALGVVARLYRVLPRFTACLALRRRGRDLLRLNYPSCMRRMVTSARMFCRLALRRIVRMLSRELS